MHLTQRSCHVTVMAVTSTYGIGPSVTTLLRNALTLISAAFFNRHNTNARLLAQHQAKAPASAALLAVALQQPSLRPSAPRLTSSMQVNPKSLKMYCERGFRPWRSKLWWPWRVIGLECILRGHREHRRCRSHHFSPVTCKAGVNN